MTNARYMLSADIEIDMRDVLTQVLRGTKHKGGGGKLTVQFLVRGHWKNQEHGPKMTLRKRIWVKPFWKGDPSTRILLRNYVVKETQDTGKEQVLYSTDGSGDENTGSKPDTVH